MPSSRFTTTVRFTDDDMQILKKLEALTGLESTSAIIRLALRESLAAREHKPRSR